MSGRGAFRRTWPRYAVAGLCGAIVSAAGLVAAQANASRARSEAQPYCRGDYADDFSALLPKAREIEQQQASYTFCIRTSAVYECPSYGRDGTLRRKKRRVVAHGTGFAYRRQGSETLLVTNQHVADWPAVTDEEHPVEDVPVGCKRVSDSLKIVDNDSDAYERDDIALSRVVSDARLDMAVLKTSAPLPLIPWKLGRSSALKERNVVDVRGFPLGVFKATNNGKVISARDHDTYKEWDHDDFVVDALLSNGNSGSPVLAISCKTGEFELVGVYHAGYTRGSALNVVVGIDEIRDFMTTLQRSPRPWPGSHIALDAASRARLLAALRASGELYFAFGTATAVVRARPDGALVFAIVAREFPFRTHPLLVLEDSPPAASDAFGHGGRVWFGSRFGLQPRVPDDLDGEGRKLLTKLLQGLRRQALAVLDFRALDPTAMASREQFERVERLEQALRTMSGHYTELVQGAIELGERFAPSTHEGTVTISAALAPPPASPPPPAPANGSSTRATAVRREPELAPVADTPAPGADDAGRGPLPSSTASRPSHPPPTKGARDAAAEPAATPE